MKKSFEQFARIKRWRNRFEDVELEQTINNDPRYYEDVLLTIFENCWHLKDYLICSKELNKKTVDDFFHNNPHMKLCQSLAIGSKHLKPNNPNVTKIRVFRPTKANSIDKQSFNVLTENGKVVDAYELAKRCIKECGDFLVQQKVIR